MRNYLNNLYNATCCTLVSDDFSEDSVDQYSFWGLNPTDELSVAGGKLTIPNGGRLRRNNCIDRVKGIRISVSTATLDRDHSLSIFFWCNSDLTAGYQIRIHNNTGAGEASRKGCLVELCNAGGSVLKSRFEGSNSSINIVEAWADADSGDAFITINDSFSWKITYLSAVAEDGYFGIGTQSDRDDLEVESYTAVLVGSTGETMGCIGECSHVTPINDCTHTAPCNGGTLDEDYWTTTDLDPNVGGWLVWADNWGPGPGSDNPSTLWSVANASSVTFSKPGTGDDETGCGESSKFWRSTGGASRFVTVSSCTNTVKLKIDITKNANLIFGATMRMIPVCGGSFTATMSEFWPNAATYTLGDCTSDDSDSVEVEHFNVPVGIYYVECFVSGTISGPGGVVGADTGLPASMATFTLEGVGSYQKLCSAKQALWDEKDALVKSLADLIAGNEGGVNDDAIAEAEAHIDEINDSLTALGVK